MQFDHTHLDLLSARNLIMQSIALEQKGFALIVVTRIPYPLVVTSIDLINWWWIEGEWYLVGPTYFWSDLKILEVLPP